MPSYRFAITATAFASAIKGCLDCSISDVSKPYIQNFAEFILESGSKFIVWNKN